jgi:hypothetical protein
MRSPSTICVGRYRLIDGAEDGLAGLILHPDPHGVAMFHERGFGCTLQDRFDHTDLGGVFGSRPMTGRFGSSKKGQDIAPAAIEEDVPIGIILASGRNLVLGEGGCVGHAQHAAIPFHRRLRIGAAIGDMVDAL